MLLSSMQVRLEYKTIPPPEFIAQVNDLFRDHEVSWEGVALSSEEIQMEVE